MFFSCFVLHILYFLTKEKNVRVSCNFVICIEQKKRIKREREERVIKGHAFHPSAVWGRQKGLGAFGVPYMSRMQDWWGNADLSNA